jgi:hypothetical protein
MPNVDTYETNTVNANDPLYNFKNKYLSVQPPVYVGGQEVIFSQSREEFYRSYPKYETVESVGTGDGVVTGVIGTLSSVPVLPGTITFSSVDINEDGLALKDVPRENPATGIITTIGDIIEPDNTSLSLGTIDYITGSFSFSFPVAPENGADIIAQTYAYQAARPRMVMFENRTFTFRPVPDKTYRVEIDAFKRPTELLNSTDIPDQAQWWQYIAYGASKKVFEDRMDVESVAAIMPEFERQRSLVLQRLVIQQSSERTATIYTDRGAQSDIGQDTI